MIEPNPEQVTTPWGDDDEANRDTLALLQEEIARLEAELRDRDEAARTFPSPGPCADPGPDRGAFEQALRRAEELEGELAGRDEMVSILLEESQLFEEAAEAQRAEWEQLNRWLDEVERRVDGRETGDSRLKDDLDAERARAESLRRSIESDRRTWGVQRVGLEREAQLLRDELARRPDKIDEDETSFIALASENRKLRHACAELESAAAESEELGRRLAATLVELEQAQRDLLHAADERERERREYEAGVVALRSQLARESLQRETDPSAPRPAPSVAAAAAPHHPAMDADERIRAFRQHLRELHEHEAAQRADRSLSARLSRLWRHTGPA